MGALHEGHGALLSRAREETGFVVVSLFINPTQFDRRDDFDRYPRSLETDMNFCSRLGADAVFAPSAQEMYPTRQLTVVEVAELGDKLCGEFRPGHFRGVATVVAKLLNIVQPDRAYFGEKDAQQLAIIARMVADLDFACVIAPVATVRESDGLAMSSRNQRLTPEERRLAPAFFRSLQAAASTIRAGSDTAGAKDAALSVLAEHPEFRVEYLEIVDPATMQPVDRPAGPVRAVGAVWLGQTRLIDNILIEI
jgi:pantoate--beta-alanine ligase